MPSGWALVGIGFSDVGVLVLALLTLLAWLSFRRPSAGRMLAVLAPLYLMALGVAWWARTTKPGGSG